MLGVKLESYKVIDDVVYQSTYDFLVAFYSKVVPFP